VCDGIDDTVRDDTVRDDTVRDDTVRDDGLAPAVRSPVGAVAGSRATLPGPAGGGYAGLVSRVAALVVDVVILTIVSLFVSALPSLSWRQAIGRTPGWLGSASAIAAGVLPWVYFTVAWWLGGRTVGGLVMGTAVERPDGRRVLLVVAALRSAIGLMLAPLWLVGLLGVLWDKRRRAWHDVVFHTVVRRTAAGTRPGPSILARRRVSASRPGSGSGTPT
jgi:uncharacterized RDD family membrane protein YckC